MAFFDDLSKKITDASTKTIQKGKDLTDVARLNAQISAEENRINTLYGMIGKQHIVAAAKNARCDDFITALPDGYNTVIGEGGAGLAVYAL